MEIIYGVVIVFGLEGFIALSNDGNPYQEMDSCAAGVSEQYDIVVQKLLKEGIDFEYVGAYCGPEEELEEAFEGLQITHEEVLPELPELPTA